MRRENTLMAGAFVKYRVKRRNMSVDGSSSVDCWSNYRFRTENLHDLMTALRIPDESRFGRGGHAGKIRRLRRCTMMTMDDDEIEQETRRVGCCNDCYPFIIPNIVVSVCLLPSLNAK